MPLVCLEIETMSVSKLIKIALPFLPIYGSHDPFITDDRFDAMLGLQFFLRRDKTQAVEITQAQAEAALRRNPEVADRFFALFPFLMEKAA